MIYKNIKETDNSSTIQDIEKNVKQVNLQNVFWNIDQTSL